MDLPRAFHFAVRFGTDGADVQRGHPKAFPVVAVQGILGSGLQRLQHARGQ